MSDLYDAAFEKALAEARAHLPNPSDPLELAACERYARAVAVEALAAAEWEAAGRPFTSTHSNGTAGAHPMCRAVEEAARRTDRALKAVPRGARRSGPPTVGDRIAANTRKPPGPKLRWVEQ